MNPNLGENFIVYSRRVSTYKCPPRAIGNEIVNVRKGEGVVPLRYCGVEKGCHAGGDAHTTKIVAFYCRLKGFAVERIT